MAKMTFESASRELDETLAKLSDESTPLAEALKLYARAAQLVSFCEEALHSAQLQVDEISAKLDTAAAAPDPDPFAGAEDTDEPDGDGGR